MALECRSSKKVQENCARALSLLGGRFSGSGEAITEKEMLRRAGFDDNPGSSFCSKDFEHRDLENMVCDFDFVIYFGLICKSVRFMLFYENESFIYKTVMLMIVHQHAVFVRKLVMLMIVYRLEIFVGLFINMHFFFISKFLLVYSKVIMFYWYVYFAWNPHFAIVPWYLLFPGLIFE